MNAIRMLTQDHRKVATLFKQFASAGSSVREQRIARKIFEELEWHTKLEEKDFYPAIDSTSDEGAALIRKAEKEHQAVDELIARLRRLSPETSEYQKDFAMLRADVEHHVGEEERRIFPYAEKVLGADNLDRVARQMTERKRGLTRPGLLSTTLERAKALVPRLSTS